MSENFTNAKMNNLTTLKARNQVDKASTDKNIDRKLLNDVRRSDLRLTIIKNLVFLRSLVLFLISLTFMQVFPSLKMLGSGRPIFLFNKQVIQNFSEAFI